MDTRNESTIRRKGRRWRFASAVLDERGWTLTVNGAEVPIEAKPLELLHELLLHAGEVVSKEALLAAVWPEVSVVEGSLATAMLKVRRALGNDGAAAIQTVPRVGYKLAVPVELEVSAPLAGLHGEHPSLQLPAASSAWRWQRWGVLAAGLTLAVAVLGMAWQSLRHTATASTVPVINPAAARDALRRLDLATIEAQLLAGWNPNTPIDQEGNGALHMVVTICEWHPAHDRQQLVLTVKTLLDADARPERRNVWGDTAYSITRAKRYCGPDHPVSHLLHVACYAGLRPVGDQCMPDYANAKGDGLGGRKP